MFSVTAGDWVALSALILTGLGMAGGVMYRGGQLTRTVNEMVMRLDRYEIRLQRIEAKLDRRRQG